MMLQVFVRTWHSSTQQMHQPAVHPNHPWPLQEDGQLHIEVAVTYWQYTTAALDKFIAERLPPWTTLLSGVTMHSEWTF